jgi:hypothetical protein
MKCFAMPSPKRQRIHVAKSSGASLPSTLR